MSGAINYIRASLLTLVPLLTSTSLSTRVSSAHNRLIIGASSLLGASLFFPGGPLRSPGAPGTKEAPQRFALFTLARSLASGRGGGRQNDSSAPRLLSDPEGPQKKFEYSRNEILASTERCLKKARSKKKKN